jgi:hypothetical protein
MMDIGLLRFADLKMLAAIGPLALFQIEQLERREPGLVADDDLAVEQAEAW